MSIRSLTRLGLAASILAFLSVASLAAEASTPLPTRKPLLQVNLKANEIYYADTYKADIDRLESGLNSVSTQKTSSSSKDKYNILINTIDMMLFRQFCDKEGIKVSDAEVNNQLAQYRTSLGAGATDAMVETSFKRQGIPYDMRTYIKDQLLLASYLKAKKADEMKAITQPSASDVIQGYEDMKFNLRRPTSYRFSMLLASTQGKSDADKKKAGDTMRAIAGKLKTNADDFDDYLAKGALDAKSAGYQAVIGLLIAKTAESKKQYPALYDAVFQLKEGQVSDLIEGDEGYSVVRASAYLPEKQLLLDDVIEGLTTTKAAATNPSATVLALVVNELQSTKYAALQKSARDSINVKLRKDGAITINLAALSEILEEPEIAAVKALKSSGYSIVLQ
jgi:hypothetical protein